MSREVIHTDAAMTLVLVGQVLSVGDLMTLQVLTPTCRA